MIQQRAAATSIELICGYEPREGVSFARNKGIELACGPFIAFTDDDCYPRQDYIDSLFARLSGNSELGFVGGRVLLFDPEDYPVTIQTHNALVQLNPGEFLSAGFIHGANFAFRQSALVQARGFDVRLGTGTRFPVRMLIFWRNSCVWDGVVNTIRPLWSITTIAAAVKLKSIIWF